MCCRRIVLNPPFSGLAVAFKQMQFLKAFEYPVREIDLDAVWVEDLPVKIVRQSFAYRKLVDFGAPARSHRIGPELAAEEPVLVLQGEPFLDPFDPEFSLY